ncbi:MAG: hypothetical protein MJ211_04280 [Bacteroidales bacterium]|nr:hypothetical protein [Bacteroidales bacterium]
MKKLLLIAILLLSSMSATFAQQQTKQKSETQIDDSLKVTLYYSEGVDFEQVFKIAGKLNAILVHKYESIKAIAICLPFTSNLNSAIEEFKNINGVLKVEQGKIDNLTKTD